jgi:hypothetical protein
MNARIFFFALILLPLRAGAQNSEVPGSHVPRLLAGFLENDVQLQELAVKMRLAEIGRQRTGIENGFDLVLSSGVMRFYSVNDGAVFSVEPEAKFAFPMFNNTSVSVSAPAAFAAGASGQSAASENTKISLSTDIVSSAGKQRKVDLLKADRVLLEARRAISKRALSAEKEFYGALRELYENLIEALTFEEEAYTKEIELAMAQKQGYAASSVYYRTIQLEALDAHRAAMEQRRTLERKLAALGRDCGFALEAVPDVPPLDGENSPEFGLEDEKSRFSEIESARWNSYIGELSREASGNLTVSAQGGVTAGNTYLGNGTSADAGLTVNWKGMSLSLGSQIPVSGAENSPVFTISLGYNLNNWRTADLSDAEKSLQAEAEALTLKTAEKNWENTVDSMRLERSDALWEMKRLYEQSELYQSLSEDTNEWFERGVVSESERRKAAANAERSRFRLLAANVRLRVLFIDWALFFAGE